MRYLIIRRDAAGGFDVKDGPYHDRPEYLGGFHVIEADSMDEAVEWAKRGRFMPGANEVRPLHGE